METALMHLKVLLPFRVFKEAKNVKRIVLETSEGSYGLLPHRLDCVAALVPGIFIYETETSGVQYLAVDEGILIKAGSEVLVSVRNAFGGVDLGKLRDSVEHEFLKMDESEFKVRSIIAKMESGLLFNLEKFRKQ